MFVTLSKITCKAREKQKEILRTQTVKIYQKKLLIIPKLEKELTLGCGTMLKLSKVINMNSLIALINGKRI